MCSEKYLTNSSRLQNSRIKINVRMDSINDNVLKNSVDFVLLDSNEETGLTTSLEGETSSLL